VRPKVAKATIAMAARPDLCAEDLEMLGAGGGTTAVLAVGICCALAARTFGEGVLLATNHSGPSASTAAATGNVLGAMWGYEVIPPGWIMSLRLRHEITRLADDLDGAALNALDSAVLYDPFMSEQ
jgi:ADP-ribosylglycohydrolase